LIVPTNVPYALDVLKEIGAYCHAPHEVSTMLMSYPDQLDVFVSLLSFVFVTRALTLSAA
jgi:hypothetical protein